MKYSALKTLILFSILPLGGYAQVGNNNNHNDDSGSDHRQEQLQESLLKAVEAWKRELMRVIPATINSYEELKVAIEALRPLDEASLNVLFKLPQEHRNEALCLASSVGNESIMANLLHAGADVEARDRSEWAPLHYAAFGGHRAIVQLLIACGADVNAWDNGRMTPLHYAATGHLDIAQLLIAHGANVNARNGLQQTPLLIAALAGHADVVEVLLEAGAQANARDCKGSTPLGVGRGNDKVVALLRKRASSAHNNNSDNVVEQRSLVGALERFALAFLTHLAQ